jgi:DNA-binding NtrC family response regulator
MVMPMMGGRELVDEIMADYPSTRVVCMSGYRKEELFREALAHEQVTLVHKPFEVGELVSVIRDALERPGEANVR